MRTFIFIFTHAYIEVFAYKHIIYMQFSLERIKWRVATKPTDKEYDRYKGLGAPYARPYSTKDFR